MDFIQHFNDNLVSFHGFRPSKVVLTFLRIKGWILRFVYAFVSFSRRIKQPQLKSISKWFMGWCQCEERWVTLIENFLVHEDYNYWLEQQYKMQQHNFRHRWNIFPKWVMCEVGERAEEERGSLRPPKEKSKASCFRSEHLQKVSQCGQSLHAEAEAVQTCLSVHRQSVQEELLPYSPHCCPQVPKVQRIRFHVSSIMLNSLVKKWRSSFCWVQQGEECK